VSERLRAVLRQSTVRPCVLLRRRRERLQRRHRRIRRLSRYTYNNSHSRYVPRQSHRQGWRHYVFGLFVRLCVWKLAVNCLCCYDVRRRGGGIKRYRDPSVCPPVCPSPRRARALGYRHAGCLQVSHVRTADPSADGRRSAASRTAIGGGACRLAVPLAITCCLRCCRGNVGLYCCVFTGLCHYCNDVLLKFTKA